MRLGQFHLQKDFRFFSPFFEHPVGHSTDSQQRWFAIGIEKEFRIQKWFWSVRPPGLWGLKHWEQPCFVFFLFSPLPSEPLCWGPPFPGRWITVTPDDTLLSFLHAWPCFVSRHLQSLVYAQCLETLTTTLLTAARLTFRGHVSTFWRKTAPPLPRPSRCWWRMMLAGPAPSPGPSR